MQGLSLKNSIEIKYYNQYLLDRLERLFFIRNELPGRMEDGSNIMDFFWQPADETTVNEIIFEIKRLIYKYETNLILTSVSAGFLPVNGVELILVIEIEYKLRNNPEISDSLTFMKIRAKEE